MISVTEYYLPNNKVGRIAITIGMLCDLCSLASSRLVFCSVFIF